VLFAILLLPWAAIAQAEACGKFVEVVVHAKGLENNLLGDPPDRKVEIYLPPSYCSDPVRRFPVLYHLHGYSLHSVLSDWVSVFQEAIDSIAEKNFSKQMIVVIPDGFNAVSGSFWMNSSVGGRWEDFIASELPSYVDEHYRTLRDRSGRAISGHSMGGFAALRMAGLHSDVFSVVYAFSPCCTDFVNDMTSTNPAWQEVLGFRGLGDVRAALAHNRFWPAALAAFAVAVSPDVGAPMKAKMPYVLVNGRVVPVPGVIERWKSEMPDQLASEHVANLKSLKGLALDYGLEDQFTHIPAGANEFTQVLEKNNVPFYFESYHGDHNQGVPERVRTRLIPFVTEKLVFVQAK
jgi:S-formylglutathione hydrolase